MMIHDLLLAPFSDFQFMQRALAGCLALSLSAPAIGVFLMLRRMSLTGDAMSHAILPGAAIGYLVAGLSVEAMTLGGLVAGGLVVLLSGAVARSTKSGEDSSLAAFYLISVALGVLLISLRGSSVDLLHVLFGSALALNDSALWLLGSISTLTLVALAILLRPLVLECLDPDYLATVSRAGSWVHMAFLLLAVLNLIAGFHALGTLMSVGIMILPGAALRYWTRRLGPMLLGSCLAAFISAISGLLFSYHLGWPTSPTIILTLGVIYFLSLLAGPQGGLMWRYIRLRHLEA
ncbi:MAG: metal ABC transporter permease [Aeromonadaceae bacterium]|nr:metal ABC transporter permease [Aeromonas sp.]MBP8221516.1 metal ABC transporter permease [Aeromonadaceae bacterium]